jgi:DNA mismatch endonuclease (patch repair protein)
MIGNRRRDTSPELKLRSALHARGWRFRVDLRIDASGAKPRPDVVFTRRRVAVFVDGCFWHGCPDHSKVPKSNVDYWRPKLARNAARDRLNDAALRADGWTVVRVWEHEPIDSAVAAVEAALGRRSTPSGHSGSSSAARSR